MEVDIPRVAPVDEHAAGGGVVADAGARGVVAEDGDARLLGIPRPQGEVDLDHIAAQLQIRLAVDGHVGAGLRVRGIHSSIDLADDLLGEAGTLGGLGEGDLAGEGHRAAPGRGGDVVGVIPVVHPALHDAGGRVGRTGVRHGRVVITAPVEPVVALETGRGGLIGEHHLVEQQVTPAESVVIDDPDAGLSAGELRDVPARPVEGLAVRPGGRADDLAVDDEVHTRLVAAHLRRLIAHDDVVEREVPPPAGRLVAEADLRLLPGELRGIP